MADVISLQPPSTPSLGRIVQPTNVNRWISTSFGGCTPEMLTAVLREAERGELERYADLCEYMLETDDHLQACVETRINGVAGKPFRFEAGHTRPEDEQLGIEAAGFATQALQSVADIERLFADLLHGVQYGYAIAEHDWYREGKAWLSSPEWIHPRLCRFYGEWHFQIRNAGWEWHDTSTTPNKFVVHLPRMRATWPTRAGLLRTAAWYWLFKRFAIRSWVTGAEQQGSPPLIGTLPPNAPAEARRALFEALENLSTSHVGIVEAGTSIEVPDMHFPTTAGVWDLLVSKFDAAISKLELGSTLNVEVGAGGGNRSLGESQNDVTITPRLEADARQLAGTIGRDWIRPLLQFNAHIWGRVPPEPKMVFEIVPAIEIQKEIFAYHLQGNLVTRDEVRKQLGLEPLEPGLGGEQLLNISEAPAAPQPAFSQLAGGEPAALPLSRTLPPSSTPALTTPTSSDCATSPLARALYGR